MIRQLASNASGLSLVAVLMVALERPAMAYVDPGTGAIIWQSIIAVLAAVAFSFRRVTFWIKNRKERKIE